jgi:Trk-type K+ transport system membrane component
MIFELVIQSLEISTFGKIKNITIMTIMEMINTRTKNLLDETSNEITNKLKKKIIIHKNPNQDIGVPDTNCIIHNIKESINKG